MLGDSKTDERTPSPWVLNLVDALTTATGRQWSRRNEAVSGSSLPFLLAHVNAFTAGNPSPTYVLINDTVNSFGTTGFEADLTTVVERIHARWPFTKIYLMNPWKAGWDSTADDWATANANVIAAHSSYVFQGPDERVWLKGADNGATMTSDTVHYSAAGQIEIVNQWMTTLGY